MSLSSMTIYTVELLLLIHFIGSIVVQWVQPELHPKISEQYQMLVKGDADEIILGITKLSRRTMLPCPQQSAFSGDWK